MKISDIFDKNELSINETFEKAKLILDKKNGFVNEFLKSPQFNDEPKYFHYVAYTKKTVKHPSFSGVGCSLNETVAQMKALTESIERYCMHFKDNRKFLNSSYNKIKGEALDPTGIAAFSELQLKKKKFAPFRVSRDSTLRWVRGLSSIRGKPIWVPSQFTSLSYNFGKKENIIRIPITNGAACGTSMAGGVLRGIEELVERDAFMITYLNKLPRDKLTTNDADIKNILSMFSRYKLELYSFDITTDIKIPTVLSIILDKTGMGPPICMGTKCHFNAKEALIGSIDEAALIRMHMRKVFITENIRPKEASIMDHKDRVLYWSKPGMLKHLNFLLKIKKVKYLEEIKSRKGDTIYQLKNAVKILKRKKLETVVVDTTKPLVQRYGFRVPITIIPKLHPFYLMGKYPYFGGKRLYTIPKILGYTDRNTTEKDLNKIPHPF